MSLSYRVTFLCNGCIKLIIHQKVLYDTFFIKKLVKWCYRMKLQSKVQLSHVLQTELPTIPKDSQLYTFHQCRLLRNPSLHFI